MNTPTWIPLPDRGKPATPVLPGHPGRMSADAGISGPQTTAAPRAPGRRHCIAVPIIKWKSHRFVGRLAVVMRTESAELAARTPTAGLAQPHVNPRTPQAGNHRGEQLYESKKG
jgi:hypothetical protein